MSDTLSTLFLSCIQNKEVFAGIIGAIVVAILGSIGWVIKSRIEMNSTKLEKVNCLIEDIINDANIYFMSKNAKATMLNIISKTAKLSSLIKGDFKKQNVYDAFQELKRCVARDEPNILGASTQNMELARLKAEDLKRLLNIRS